MRAEAAGDDARTSTSGGRNLPKTIEACQVLARQVAQIHCESQTRLAFIERILAGQVRLPQNCKSRAALAEKELEPLLDALREAHACVELIRSAMWEEDQRR